MRTSARMPLSPTALPLADAARLLSRAAGVPITEAMLQTDLAAGAPANMRWHDQPGPLRRLAGEGDGPWRLTRDNCGRASCAGC